MDAQITEGLAGPTKELGLRPKGREKPLKNFRQGVRLSYLQF